MPKVGDPAPDFTVATDGGGTLRLADLRGQRVVLYFYPRDNTPGCTTEACDFRDAAPRFADKNTVILGVSTDSVQSHDRFKAKHELPFPLLSDSDREIAEAYGTWREKSLYGKKFMGMVRCTFVIDEEGTIAAVYDKVRVKGHVEALLGTL